MEVKAKQMVTLWDGRQGHVHEIVANKANVVFSNGRRSFVNFNEITAAIDTFSEKDAKFLAAKDKLHAFKQAAKKTAGMSTSEFSQQYGLYVSRPIGGVAPEWIELGSPSEGSKFAVTFDGKEASAIGITYPMYGIVYAADEEAAKLKLYDKYDHIKLFKTKKIDETTATKAVQAPGHVDEDIWDKAKAAVKESSGKNIDSFGDKEWATVTTVYKNMDGRLKSEAAVDVDEKGVVPSKCDKTAANEDLTQFFTDMELYDQAKRNLEIAKGIPVDKFSETDWENVDLIHQDLKKQQECLKERYSSKTAAHPNEYAVKYPAGTILVQDGKAEEFIHVLDYVPDTKNYILTKRPVPADQAEGKLQGTRYELSAKTVDSDKSLRVLSGKAVDAGKPSDLVSTEVIGSNLKLSFKEFDAVYTPEGILASTTATPKQFSKEYRKEFGLMVKNMGFDKISSLVMHKRLASKLNMESITAEARISSKLRALAVGTTGLYKSDADIADEFSGMGIVDIDVSTKDWKDKEHISGGVTLNFPEAGENVAGGQEGESQVYDSWHFYNFSDWKEKLTPEGDSSVSAQIAFNSWYPEETYLEIKENILEKLVADLQGATSTTSAAVEARLAKKLAAMEPAAVTKVEGAKPYTDVRVTYENGDTVDTGINLTLEEARDYYLGKDRKGRIFNLGFGYDSEGGEKEDNLVKAVSVEEIPSTTETIARRLAKKAARLGNYDFDIHGGKTWVLEASEEGAPKIKRKDV